RKGFSTSRLDRCAKHLGSRIEALDGHAKIIEKALGFPSLGFDGGAEAGRISLTIQIEMLTGRFCTAEDTGPAPKVPKQVPGLCDHGEACQITLVLLLQECEPLAERRRLCMLRPLGVVGGLKFAVSNEELATLFREATDHRAVLVNCAV